MQSSEAWKRRLADAVIDHRAQFAAGDVLDAGGEILLAIEDGVVAAVGFGERGLVFGADRADDIGAEIIRPLAQQETDAARRGVDEHVHAVLDLEGAAQEKLRRDPLGEPGCGLLEADRVGQFDGPVRRHEPLGGVAAEAGDISDAVAGLEIR